MQNLKKFCLKLNNLKLNIKIFITLTSLALLSIIILVFFFFLEDIYIICISSKTRSLLIDLSIGYVISYVFYIIQIYIPENIKKYKFKEINKNKIKNIIEDLNIIFISITQFYNIEDNGIIKPNNKNSVVIKIKNSSFNKASWYTEIYKSEIIGSNNIFDTIIGIINKIKTSSLLENMDIEFIILLNNIENSCNKIIQNFTIINEYENKSLSKIPQSEDILQSLNELKKYKKNLQEYTILVPAEYELATKTECENYRNKIDELVDVILPLQNGRYYISIECIEEMEGKDIV